MKMSFIIVRECMTIPLGSAYLRLVRKILHKPAAKWTAVAGEEVTQLSVVVMIYFDHLVSI